MLKSGSGFSEDPLWSSSSSMSTKSSSLERERMKEEAKKERARRAAAAAFKPIQKLPDISFEPRKVQPNVNDPIFRDIESALGPFEDLVPAIRRKQLHLFIGIDSSVPGTPEVNEVNFENVFKNNTKDGHSLITASHKNQDCNRVKPNEESKNHTVYNARRKVSPKQNHASHMQPEKTSAGFRESQVRPKPPKLNMPSGENAGIGKSSSIKIENILKEMTHGISQPPLTDIQTPVKGSGNKFAFPHPPPKDNQSLHRGRTKVQEVNGPRKNDELLEDDLHLSEDETDEDQTSSHAWASHKQAKLPSMDRRRGLSTSSTSSSDGSSSESDSDTDSSDSDSSHNPEAASPKKELNRTKTPTSTLNSTHVRTKDLEPDTKSQSPLNRKLESHSRKKRLDSSNDRDSSSFNLSESYATHNDTSCIKPEPEPDIHPVEASPYEMPELNCLNFETEHSGKDNLSNETQIENEPANDFKEEPIDSILKPEPLDLFGATDAADIDLHDKTRVNNADDAFLEERVFPGDAAIDFDEMLGGSLFSSSGDFEKLEEKLSRPSEYPTYDNSLGDRNGQQMEPKAPPVLENPQQILCERSRLLDDPSRVLGEPPHLIEEAPRNLNTHFMSTDLLTSSNCSTSSSFETSMACVASNPSMELDGILDTHNQSIFTMSGMLSQPNSSSTTNCLSHFTEQSNLVPHEDMNDTIENNMNIQNSQDEARLLQYENAFELDHAHEKPVYNINNNKSSVFEEDLKMGVKKISNGTSLKIKLPLSKIRVKSKQGKVRVNPQHVNKGKSIEQIMEAKKAHECRENEPSVEVRKTVGEKSIRSGKRPAEMPLYNHEISTRTDQSTGEIRNKIPRSASEDDEEIDVVGIHDSSSVKRTSANKRNKRTPSLVGSSRSIDLSTDNNIDSAKDELLPFSLSEKSSIIPSCNFKRSSLGSEVVNKKGEVTTIPTSIPYVQVPLKPIGGDARKLKSPVQAPRMNGICTSPKKPISELKVKIDLKKLKRIPGGAPKKVAEEPPTQPLSFEIPKRPPKSESESSDMVISPLPASADVQETLETISSFDFTNTTNTTTTATRTESPLPEVIPPKPLEKKLEVTVDKPEVKNKRGRPRKKRDNDVISKNSTLNPDVCTCGALRKDAARDTIRLGKYRATYITHINDGQKTKHRADCLTNAADKARMYIESVLHYVQFLIGLEVSGKTKTRQGMDEFMRTNSECIGLVDHVINHYTRKTNATIHVRDERFLFLCLRLQSLLYFKLFQVKKESTAKHAKLLSEYFKLYKNPSSRRSPTYSRPSIKGSTGTPSPMSPGPSPGGSVASVGSAGSSGSSGSSDKLPSGGTISIPIDMYDKALQYLTYTKYMLHGMRLWDDADSVVSTCQEFTNDLAKKVGYLTTKSSMLHVVDYIRAGLDMIKDGMNA